MAVASDASAPGRRARRPLPWSSTSGIPTSRASPASSAIPALLGEPDHAEVARVHLQDHGRVGGERRPVVGEPRAVRGPDLDEACAALPQHLGDAERAPDLDELAAAHDHLAARGQRVDGEEHGGGAVVDDDRRLDTEERAQAALRVLLAVPAHAAGEVVLEVRVGGGDLRHPRGGLGRQRGAPEVRVHDDARRVDDPHERGPRRRARGAPRPPPREARRGRAPRPPGAPRAPRAPPRRRRCGRGPRRAPAPPAAAGPGRRRAARGAGRRRSWWASTEMVPCYPRRTMARERPGDFAERLPRVVPKEETDLGHLSDEMVDLLYPGRRPRPFRVGVRFFPFDEPGYSRAVALARESPVYAERDTADGKAPRGGLRRRCGAEPARAVRARQGTAGHRGARRRQEGPVRARAVAAAVLDLPRPGGLRRAALRGPRPARHRDPPAAGEVGPLLRGQPRGSRRPTCRRRSRRSSAAGRTRRSATTASASATRA